MRVRTINVFEDRHIKKETVVGIFKNNLISIQTTYRKDHNTNRLIQRHKFFTISNDSVPMADDKSVLYRFKDYDMNGKRLDIEV